MMSDQKINFKAKDVKAHFPTAIQHEKALIGAMLKNPDCREKALNLVCPEHFAFTLHQAVIRAFGVIGKGDYLELISELERTGFINGDEGSKEAGKYLSDIIQQTGTSAGTEHYALKIREAALRRDILHASEKLTEDAGNLKLDVGDLLGDRIAGLNEILEQEKAVSEGKPGRKGLDACVIGFDELLKMDTPERAMLLPWLPEGGIVMVYGGRGIGKTFFTLSLAASASSGAPFLKWGEPSKTVGVLIVDGEMALSDLRSRLTALLIRKPIEPVMIISSEVAFAKTERDINLVDGAQRNDILSILDGNKEIRLVIIDNISCLFSGIRESSKDDWEQITPWLLAMRRRGVAVVLVHHAGKGGDQRGTSGREDLLDTVIKLDPVNGSSNDGARFIVKFTKSRGAYGDDVKAFEASLDLDSNELWSWRQVEESNYERMLSLAGEGVSSVTDMAEELGITKGTVSKLKKKGIDAGDLAKGSTIQRIKKED
jgi:RecA/RadA recombinase